ncbi:GNAT family N-acetyltransferase [Dyadobacter sp. CY312]|uniref:GNAT family N-acetyltransferase n=1 Tax=Dyadobacter sp. CY312 TaxID=2907303 RepID=UPI001F1DEB14|nr:GNAT family protein [Dyadobacter sp. CY312]MCE7040517.1 GNAT family N-acetyltransferase [Dyadobacter sp. CY312]
MRANFPTIKTDRLLLRQFVDGDLENVYTGLSNPDVIKYYGVSFDSLEATREQMVWFADLEKKETGIWWAVCSSDKNTFYGGIGFNNLCKEHRKAEIGFWLLPEFWGKGILKEAMPLVLNHAFTFHGLHRIEAFVESENQNCKIYLNKMSFRHEGTMINCEIKNNEFISVDIYARLKTGE